MHRRFFWSGWLALDNYEEAVAAIRKALGCDEPEPRQHSWVAANGLYGFKPEVEVHRRFTERAKDMPVPSARLYADDGAAAISLDDQDCIIGIHTSYATQAEAAAAWPSINSTYLEISEGQVKIRHYTGAHHELWWVLTDEGPVPNNQEGERR